MVKSLTRTAASIFVMLGLTNAQATPADAVKNVVLVHGAFVDGSGWNKVADILRKDGYHVAIVQPPETSLGDDVAATDRILDQLDGPAVLVGHSYGGAIITEAGNNTHVKSLVYVAALQPDVGESAGQLLASKPAASNDIAPSKDGFLFIPVDKFHDDFAADLPHAQTDLMAVSQVPPSVKAITEAISAPAWKDKPSYAIVATQDRAINPELERAMYKRSHSITTEIDSSHVVYMSQPRAVAKIIEAAANAE
ncbi:alpha/beta fold hydrolase [Caballeronia sordidicola]|uniref:Putative signal peptide protein n=1 Tax=Caballeronia sordidicola TaxID=196367 RepID=A0A242MSR8_CABSO|nr:alpha/beta hydrolase [Caballeronia sordidicola]OTP74282.1 putative signal peptide protein [Caballeronia sordidicola]